MSWAIWVDGGWLKIVGVDCGCVDWNWVEEIWVDGVRVDGGGVDGVRVDGGGVDGARVDGGGNVWNSSIHPETLLPNPRIAIQKLKELKFEKVLL